MIEEILDNRKMLRNVTVGTAHTYQGDERDIMIFSPVVSRGISDYSAKWVETPRNLINVAITHAREALFVVADFEICRRQVGILGELIKFLETVNTIREPSMEELDLFSWMVLQGWAPDVHKNIRDIEVDFILERSGVRLAIEVDGTQHENQKSADASRDAFLASHGYEVLRIPARAIRETPALVLKDIASRLEVDLTVFNEELLH